MQLTFITIIVLMLMYVNDMKAQITKFRLGDKQFFKDRDSTELNTEVYLRPDWKKIDINFLNSYYAQDGNNGAVTGGIGTEQLTDFTQKLSVNFPTSEKLRWNINAAYDYYSSASTDNIDNIQSSDSASDVRSQFSIGIDKKADERTSMGVTLGTSIEYDYYSVFSGVNFSKLSKTGNTRIDVNAQVYYDLWQVIFPVELRGEVSVPTDRRQSYNLALGLSQVMNKRMQLAVIAEATFMNGLLSTPFHRVYFQEQNRATIENLPSQRLKLPVAARWNVHLTERLIMRSYYRYYWDSWGMQAHTASIELPIKINRFFTVYPHYRYHQQTAVDYFAGYKEHVPGASYYSSDYDLSALTSHNYGLGLMYAPAEGLAKLNLPFRKRDQFVFESIDIKYSHYSRCTGLQGDIISLGIKMSF